MIALFLVSCGTEEKGSLNKPDMQEYVGNYVTDGYARRAEGYDWSVVSIVALTDSTADIAIHSRADIKKESCSFEGPAVLSLGGDTLVSEYDDAHIWFVLSSDTLTISSDTPNLLYFFCSGGGTLAGKYVRLHEKLDSVQLSARR